MIPVLETARTTLRPLRAEDADAAIAFFGSERSHMAGGPLPPDRAWRAFAAMIGHWELRGFGLWALTLPGDDTIRGTVGHWAPHGWPEQEVGWALWDATLEGKGYAHEAARETRRYAYEVLNWSGAVSYIAEANARSIALAERLGCRLDPDAPQPAGRPCLVYRHPGPEAP